MRNSHFDLLLLDLMMPKMSGEEVARQVRKGRDREMPILVLTSVHDTRRLSDSLLAGGTYYVSKTASPDTLIEVARQVASLAWGEKHALT
jgi:DNA-binding response OmpR family regulator